MRLATYRFDDGAGPALVLGDRVADLRRHAPTMRALLAAGLHERPVEPGPDVPLDLARLLPPVPDPALFLGVGLNYRDHAAEVGRAPPERPPVFAKLPASLVGPYDAVAHPGWSDTFDYEGELGVVVGRGGRGIAAEDAMAHVAGYVVVNDLTVRALAAPDTLLLAKNGPGMAPFGPWITTADEIADPHALPIRTWVNGEPRQDGRTDQLHHRIPQLVAFVSRAVPLSPGDVISTGSPAGSGAGFSPPRWLRPGDAVRVGIDGLGAIENRIVGSSPGGGRS